MAQKLELLFNVLDRDGSGEVGVGDLMAIVRKEKSKANEWTVLTEEVWKRSTRVGEAALTLCVASSSAHWMRTGTEELMCALHLVNEPLLLHCSDLYVTTGMNSAKPSQRNQFYPSASSSDQTFHDWCVPFDGAVISSCGDRAMSYA